MPIFTTLDEVTWSTLFNRRQLKDNIDIRMLKIPAYQRSYVWDEKRILNLLTSIIASFKEDEKYYFLGTKVLCKEDNGKYKNYLIVDGQQRITSLTIIISTIKFIARENSFRHVEHKCTEFLEVEDSTRHQLDEAKYKLCLPDLEKLNIGTEFRYYIQNTKINELRNYNHLKNNNLVMNEYMMRLQANSNIIYDQLYDKDEDFLYDLVRYISNRCKFILMITDQFLDAHRIFCTLNITGEELSAVDFYRARFYGHLVRERGLREANRIIDTKLNIWNKIHAEIGNKEMKYFLAHFYRIKMIELNRRDDFISSFNLNDHELLQFFSTRTGDVRKCDEFLDDIMKYFDIWKKIFLLSDRIIAKDVLKLLRHDYCEVWLTIAIFASANNFILNKDFWCKLEKFIAILMVAVSSRYASYEMMSVEFLNRCFDELLFIEKNKQLKLICDPIDLEFFIQRVKGEIYSKLNDKCLIYLMVRINYECKHEVSKHIRSIDGISIDLIYPLNVTSTSEWSKKEELKNYVGYIGNFMLVNTSDLDKFKDKEWNEKKASIDYLKYYQLSLALFNQVDWNFNGFKEAQEFYVDKLGRAYNIKELRMFKLPTVSLKRKIDDVINEDDEIIYENTITTEQESEPEPQQPSSTSITDADISVAASQINNYLRQNFNKNIQSIQMALKPIDPQNTGIVDREIMFKLLIYLQKNIDYFQEDGKQLSEIGLTKQLKMMVVFMVVFFLTKNCFGS